MDFTEKAPCKICGVETEQYFNIEMKPVAICTKFERKIVKQSID